MPRSEYSNSPAGAIFSKDRKYRYLLWRKWSECDTFLGVVGLNPSTADEPFDDPTIRRCIGFARDWGYAGLYVLNLFAFRATKPTALRAAIDPVGADNDRWLWTISKNAALIIAAWGNDGLWGTRASIVLPRLSKPYCLGLTKLGAPRHPLYVKKTQAPIEFSMRM